MSDATYRARINVEIEGVEQIARLGNAFEQLRAGGPSRVRTVAAASGSRAVSAAGTVGEQVGEKFGYAIGGAIRAPFDAVRLVAGQAAGSMVSFLGPLARIGVTSVAATPGIVAAGVAAVAVGIPLINLAATFKIMRLSFRWAQDQADAQVKLIARTRRAYPGLVGEAFSRQEPRVRAKFAVASALFGEQAVDALEQRLTRMFTSARMQRGIGGEKDIFTRMGITPQALQLYERKTGERVGVTDYLMEFIRKREELDARLARTQEGTAEYRRLVAQRAQFADDSLKLFGSKFADVLQTWSREDVKRLYDKIQDAAPLAEYADADQRARNFKVELATTQNIFQQLKRGIGGEVQPVITDILEKLNQWLLPVQSGGMGMGTKLRELASALAIHAWETLRSLLSDIDVGPVNSFIRTIQNWNPAATLQTLVRVGSAIGSMVESINLITKFVSGVVYVLDPKNLPKILWAGMTGGPDAMRAAIAGAYGAEGLPYGGRAGPAGIGALPGEYGGRGGGAAAGTSMRDRYLQRIGAGGGGGYLGQGTSTGSGYLGGGGVGAGAGAGGAGATQDWITPPSGMGSYQKQTWIAEKRRGMPDEFNAAAQGYWGGPRQNQTWVTLKDGQKIQVNAAVATRFQGFLNELIDQGYPVKVGAGYVNKQKFGGGGLSMHAYGTAIDTNVPANWGTIAGGRTNTTDMPRNVEEIAWKHGLSWGGRFGDPMHFEAMGPRAVAQTQEQLRQKGLPTQPTAVSQLPPAQQLPQQPQFFRGGWEPVSRETLGGAAGGAGATGVWPEAPALTPAQAQARATATGRVIPMQMQTPEVMAALQEVGARQGIDPLAIASIINTESKWNTRAVTGRYRGLTQIGPENPEWSNIGSMSAADQIRTYGKWLDRYKFSSKRQQAGVDFSRMSVAQQAAYLQGFQFAPNALAWQRAAGQGRADVRTTTTRQARVLGTTTLAEMTRYYQGLTGGALPGAVAEGPPMPTQAATEPPAPPPQEAAGRPKVIFLHGMQSRYSQGGSTKTPADVTADARRFAEAQGYELVEVPISGDNTKAQGDAARTLLRTGQFQGVVGFSAGGNTALGLQREFPNVKMIPIGAGRDGTVGQIKGVRHMDQLSAWADRAEAAAAGALAQAPPPEAAAAAAAAIAPTGRGRVSERQMGAGKTRSLPISASTRQALEYAAAVTGVNVEVTSGGQTNRRDPNLKNRPGGWTGSTRHDLGGAADVVLRDPQTGNLLDMTKPADAARMAAFMSQSVRAGATGVGAGLGYMGKHTMHIGGGSVASWGGANWVRPALQQGRQSLLTQSQVQAALAKAAPPPSEPLTVAAADVTPEIGETPQQRDERVKALSFGAPTTPAGGGAARELTEKPTMLSEKRAERAKKESDEARKELEKPAPKKDDTAIKEGTAAGRAAGKAFNEEIKETKIPVKLEEDKKRDESKDDEEKKAA